VKYKVKTKECQLVVTAKATFGETIAAQALDTVSQLALRSFLKPKQVKARTIEYTGPVGVCLHDRLARPLSKRDFLFIIEQIVIAVRKIAENNLNMEYVVWNTKFVFMNETTKELRFLYVPSVKTAERGSLLQFLDSVVYSVIPAEEADPEFVSRFVYYLKSQQGFSTERIEKYVEKEDKSIVNTLKRHHTNHSSFITNKQQHYYEHYEQKQAKEEELPTDILEETERTALLEEEEETTRLLSEEFENETDLLREEDEGTALLTENSGVIFPTMQRVSTGEIVSINKPVFRLGKERSYVDYFVANNNAVSRSHADIITRGSKYFVVDLNSKNHTYVNEQILAPHCETALFDGDRVKLGNEEFLFRI